MRDEIDDRWALMGNVGWQDWSEFGEVEIGIDNTQNPASLTNPLSFDAKRTETANNANRKEMVIEGAHESDSNIGDGGYVHAVTAALAGLGGVRSNLRMGGREKRTPLGIAEALLPSRARDGCGPEWMSGLRFPRFSGH